MADLSWESKSEKSQTYATSAHLGNVVKAAREYPIEGGVVHDFFLLDGERNGGRSAQGFF